MKTQKAEAVKTKEGENREEGNVEREGTVR